MVQTDATSKKNILEIACGTGMHSLAFAKSMMKEGSTLVCTDISDKMVTSAKGRFENPKDDFVSN